MKERFAYFKNRTQAEKGRAEALEVKRDTTILEAACLKVEVKGF